MSGIPRPAADLVTWRKSSYSGYAGNCTEVAVLPTATEPGYVVGVRDSKDPNGPVLEFSPGAWAEFLDKVKAEAEPIPTKIPDLSGVPLGELAERERGATFSSCI